MATPASAVNRGCGPLASAPTNSTVKVAPDCVTLTFAAPLLSAPTLESADRALWISAAVAVNGMSAVAWPMKVRWNGVAGGEPGSVISSFSLIPGTTVCSGVMSTWATTSVGLKGASVNAFRFSCASSAPPPPFQNVSSKSDCTRSLSAPVPPARKSGTISGTMVLTVPSDASKLMSNCPALPVAEMLLRAPTSVNASCNAVARVPASIENGSALVSW